MANFYLVTFIFIFSITLTVGLIDPIDTKSKYCFRRVENLGTSSGPALVEWLVDSELETVTFDVQITTTEATIGLGLSHSAKFTAAEPVDFVVIGLDENGESFLKDMNARVDVYGELKIQEDSKQSYFFRKVSRNDTVLRAVFGRKWDTSDRQDIVIDMSLIHVMLIILPGNFSKPEMTTLNVFHTFEAYLLDPDYHPNMESVKSWTIKQKILIPDKTTTYWCQLHKFPEKLRKKHHIIGFKTKLDSEKAKRHTHHIVLYKCDILENTKEIYEPHVTNESGVGGEECYFAEKKKLPIKQCRTYAYVWGYGGKEFFLPNDTGFPIGDAETEYYVMETHFDNPHSLRDLEIEIGLEIYYTDQLRENDAGLAITGYEISPSLVIPPKSENMVISGHCKPQCTAKFIPEDGITVFGVMLHSHMSGRKITLSHFSPMKAERGFTRIIYDDHYDFLNQITRPLLKRQKIYPGDHLLTRCSYNTKWKNGTTLGGLSTQEEMCLGILWYYPKIPTFNDCSSMIPLLDVMRTFGVENVELGTNRRYWELVVTEPEKFENRTLQDVLDHKVKWTNELRESTAKLYEDYSLHEADRC